MAPQNPNSNTNTPLAAKPTRTFFDPWNSSFTGHQRAENRLAGSTSWRSSRNLKLSEQFASGAGGGRRVADTVGAGSEGFGEDGRLENGGWERGAKGSRGRGQLSVLESFGGCARGEGKSGGEGKVGKEEEGKELDLLDIPSAQPPRAEQEEDEKEEEATHHYHQDTHGEPSSPTPKPPQIFTNLTIYINGSTYPKISDHKLKHLLVTHGANLTQHLSRRTVTHVILGTPNTPFTPSIASTTTTSTASTTPLARGAGGGLAASKIQKEIVKKVGRGAKLVTVDWIVECLRVGKRVSEERFEGVRTVGKGVIRVGEMFAKVAAKKG